MWIRTKDQFHLGLDTLYKQNLLLSEIFMFVCVCGTHTRMHARV